MALLHPVDVEPVKRGTVLSFDDAALSTGYDAFRLKVYKLAAAGASALILTSDYVYALPVTLTVADANSPALFTFEAEDGMYYRIVIEEVDQDGTATENEVDEFYVFVFPDSVPTEEGSFELSTLFSKLLWMLGHNILDGEFDNTTGYTTSRVRRGYSSLLPGEAITLLAASDAPGDVDVLFKSKAVVSIDSSGQEEYTLELEQ